MATLTDDQIIKAIDAAPPLVQETLRSAKTAKTIATIGATYRLHIDQIGVLAQINRNLLIGLVDPSEMYGELVAAGIEAETAKLIMNDINQQIFVPLRETMRGGNPSQPTAPVTPQAPQPKPVVPQPVAAPVAPTQPSASVQAPSVRPQAAPPPSIQAAQPTQVYTANIPWPGAPAGNWQPAAAVHVYVPGPAPMPQQEQPVQYAPLPRTVVPEQAPVMKETEPVVRAAAPQPVIPQATRPTPPVPDNLPGASAQGPASNLPSDPYREPV